MGHKSCHHRVPVIRPRGSRIIYNVGFATKRLSTRDMKVFVAGSFNGVIAITDYYNVAN